MKSKITAKQAATMLGKLGGSVKSEKKAKSSRLNGMKHKKKEKGLSKDKIREGFYNP